MFQVRRIGNDEGELLRALRLAALADRPGDSSTTLERASAHDRRHWDDSAAANSSGPVQATFVIGEVGMIGAYANRDGTVNVVGLWAAPGHRDVGVADALLEAVASWARSEAGARRLRIWVVERNEHARAFYEERGFSSSGNEIPYSRDESLRQLEMVRTL